MSWVQSIFFLIFIISVHCFTIEMGSTTQSLPDKVTDEIRRILNEIKQEQEQLELDRQTLKEEKKILKSVNNIDVLRINVGGKIITTTRQTLTKIHKSILSALFNGRWEHKLQIDQNRNIFFDFNPILFHHLIDQLQTLDSNNQIELFPPSQLSLVKPFRKMLRKLELDQLLSSEKKNVITFNVGGQTITNRRATLTPVSNSTVDTIVAPSKTINSNNESDVFIDYDPKLFQHLISQLREESFENISFLGLSSNKERISFQTMLTDLNIFITTTTTTTTTTTREINSSPPISINTKWKQNALTIAGGNGYGNQSYQLSSHAGIYVDDDNQCIYIADTNNHRIVEWKFGAKMGEVVAGGNGPGNQTNQLDHPIDVIVDKKSDSLIICDRGNRRVVRWSRRNGTVGETIIADIRCYGLAMDNNGDLYVSDFIKDEVRRWKTGDTKGTIVAGENGGGNQFNQLNHPTYLFVDEDQSVYVSGRNNHRVVKWVKGAKEGVVVAGGQGRGDSLRQLSYPEGVTVDHLGNVYVADGENNRIVCWSKGSKEGRLIVGGNGEGQQPNQLNYPHGLSFDRQGNLYVVDIWNQRVQKFDIDQN